MRLRSRNGWLATLALVAGIATFTLAGTVYADDNGCKSTSTPCMDGGKCGFVSLSDGDFCVCQKGDFLIKTCDCSTGQYPPCGPGLED